MKADPVPLLADLVAIPSPSAAPNRPMTDYAEKFLRPRGWRIQTFRYRDEAGTEKRQLIATTPGRRLRPELALCAHTDTVGWDPAWRDATTLSRRAGRLQGRGTCDMKGFIAAALAAVSDLDPGRLDRPLALVLTADEEVGCLGAKRLLAQNEFHPKYAIIGEPTSLRPVRAGKGYGLAEITVQGREAHSAYPGQGASAIYPAAALVTQTAELGKAIASRRHGFFDPPHPTLNVGVLTGGRAKNIVPGECRFLLEWRPVPGVHSAALLRPLHRAAARVPRSHPGCTAAINVLRDDAGFETPAASRLVRALEEVSGHRATAIAFNSEAPQFRALGAEVAVFGPGDMRVAHRTGEFLPARELAAAVRLLRAVIARFCGPRLAQP
jgi:acetylornithine deacetylase